jgi:O-antigen ligase
VKWIVLSGCLVFAVPLSDFLRRNPHRAQIVWMLIGLLPFVIQYFHFYMAVDSAIWGGGYVKGAEISILDVLALALYFATGSPKQALPFRFVMSFYFLMVVFSAFEAWQPKLSLMYAWQLARMYLVYATVARGCSDPRVSPSLMTGLGLAIIFELCFVVWQRFGQGMVQTYGTEDAPNLLGVMSHFVILPFFALVLNGRRGAFPIVVLLAGIIVVVSTASRAAVGLEVLGLATIFALSAMRKWTPWKQRILILGVLATALILPAVNASFKERFNVSGSPDSGDSQYDEREAYKKAAALMLSEHPLGIGANQFAVIGNMGGYYSRAGVKAAAMARAGNVHNAYYLTAAEMGYPGVVALLLLLISPLFAAFRCGWRNLGDYRGDLVLGLGVALLIVALHSWFEWSFVTFPVQYLLAIELGLIAGNAQQLGYWSLGRRNATRVQVSDRVFESRPVNQPRRPSYRNKHSYGRRDPLAGTQAAPADIRTPFPLN